MDILDEIQKQYVNFSQKEKQIAMYILQKNNEIKNINIGKLAEQTGTSSATITRFCRKIGCESFVDMKIQISAAEQDGIPLESSDIFDSVYSYYNRVIDRTKKNIDKEELERVITDFKRCSENLYLWRWEFRAHSDGNDATIITYGVQCLRYYRFPYDVD
ncbi:MurR/RpiR family transcriptional regulator [Erysipelothrix sp. Poltava]|nr:MurR/RpiR family transcriptional regulator [Erysipelothrix sp. Poltava]